MGSYTQRRHQTSSVSAWIKFTLLGVIVSVLLQGVSCEVEPTESQCRTHIEKALKEHHLDADEKVFEDAAVPQVLNEEEENFPTDEFTNSTEGSETKDDINNDEEEADVKKEEEEEDEDEDEDEDENEDDDNDNDDSDGAEDAKLREQNEDDHDNEEEAKNGQEEDDDLESKEDEKGTQGPEDNETKEDETEQDKENEGKDIEKDAEKENDDTNDQEMISEEPIEIEVHEIELDADNYQDDKDVATQYKESEESENEIDRADTGDENDEENVEEAANEGEEDYKDKHEEIIDGTDTEDEKEGKEKAIDDVATEDKMEMNDEENNENEVDIEGKENEQEDVEEKASQEEKDDADEETDNKVEDEAKEVLKRNARDLDSENAAEREAEEDEGSTEEKGQEAPEEELIKEMVIPDNLRPRSHISKILKLEDSNTEAILEKTIDTTLRALKGLYENGIKPLEMLYKYRDLSNRHFGDPEIFSKPLILFMGPWSGGKSSTINYLLDNEFSHTSLRTGAEPSPAYFNILMYGEEEEILDGTQLAGDWTFSGLQKFGQGLLDRLKGIKLPNKLLEKVNIVEIPGILEIRKQVQRLFPFNDACQWFIDRADIIFLVYDPSKLDVGPETEAILDQLKGREYQTRIVLNKADQVKPEELMRVQGTLIWNISPLMSSSEPPIMYSTSLWSLPYETGAPIRLLQAQERALLRDLREAIDKRVENKIASARRFAVRVRNHAKMVDCYLTTYYNHKTIFGNRKKISDDIIEFPQKYHIYEGLSTLTNISRYDLPDPDVYKDFFKINPLYDFKKLSETCTYFRGCPINKLDVVIAYDLPELIGKYKKAVEGAKEELQKENS